MNVFKEPIPQKPVEKDTKVEETKEKTGKGTHIITTKWDISNSLGAKIVKMFLTGTRDYISKWSDNGFLRKVVTGSTSPFERVKTTFYGMGPGFRKAITTVGVSTLLVGMLSFPFNTPVQAQSLNTQGQTSIQEILEQRKKQQSQLSSEETQVQETSQQNNLIKQPDVDPNDELNPYPQFVYIKGLPEIVWSKLDLNPVDNEKFGIPKPKPGELPDEIAEKYKNLEQLYRDLIGKSDVMEVDVRTFRGEYVRAYYVFDTGVGRFTFNPVEENFYPLALSIKKDSAYMTGVYLIEYKGVDGKLHKAATFLTEVRAEKGKPPVYISYHLPTGMTVKVEYRYGEHIFEDPFLKQWEPNVKRLLNRLDEVKINEVRVNKNYKKESKLGDIYFLAFVNHQATQGSLDQYQQRVGMVVIAPELYTNPDQYPKTLYVLTHDPDRNETSLAKIEISGGSFRGFSVGSDNRLYYYGLSKGASLDSLKEKKDGVVGLLLGLAPYASKVEGKVTLIGIRPLLLIRNGKIDYGEAYAKAPTPISYIPPQR